MLKYLRTGLCLLWTEDIWNREDKRQGDLPAYRLVHILVQGFIIWYNQNVDPSADHRYSRKGGCFSCIGINMGELSHIKSKLLAEQVQEQIYQYIINSKIEIGDKLPNEFELGEKFGVGRSTIREAVKQLVSRGVLEVRRGSGTYVVSTTPVDLDPLGLRAVKDKMALAMDLVNVRLVLEPGIAEMAALNANEQDVKKLRGLCDSIEWKIENDVSYIEDDIAFHTCVAECSKNMVVEQLIPIIDTAVMMFVNVTHKKLTKETIMTHRAVTEAIAEHDPIGARTAMMMHMTFNRNMIKELMKTS